MKDWILRYAEEADSSEDELDKNSKDENPVKIS